MTMTFHCSALGCPRSSGAEHSGSDAGQVQDAMADKTDKVSQLKVKDITLDRDMQPRVTITQEAVEEYRDRMEDGEEFPPIAVVKDGSTLYCVDGWHRVMAAKALKAKTIGAVVTLGTRMDAIWVAAQANLRHGVRRTNADKRRAVALALMARPDSSFADIATHCAVTREMVRQHAKQAEEAAQLDEAIEAQVEEAMEAAEDIGEVSEVDRVMMAAEAAMEVAVDSIDAAMAASERVASTPHGIYVNAQSVAADLKNARTAIKQAMPYKVCPICNGDGCDTCRNSGWVSKRQWDLIPKNQRG